MTRDRLGMVWAGLGLIGLGLAVLAASLFGWASLWPLFPVLAGLGLFVSYLVSGAKDGGLAFLGTLAILSGLFLFGFTLGVWTWEEMATLWPVFLAIVGIAFLVAFLAERRSRDFGVLGLGLAALVVASSSYLYGIYGQLGHTIGSIGFVIALLVLVVFWLIPGHELYFLRQRGLGTGARGES